MLSIIIMINTQEVLYSLQNLSIGYTDADDNHTTNEVACGTAMSSDTDESIRKIMNQFHIFLIFGQLYAKIYSE
jgi:hypothetical protein